MGNNLNDALALVVEAGKTIGKDRPGVHGSAENSFQMIGDLWSAYLSHTMAVRNTGDYRIMPQDVARMMELMKIARSIYGDPNNRDNYVDSIGYAALAGMLQLPSQVNNLKDKAAIADKEFERSLKEGLDEKSVQ
jgi:hypothetical protein